MRMQDPRSGMETFRIRDPEGKIRMRDPGYTSRIRITGTFSPKHCHKVFQYMRFGSGLRDPGSEIWDSVKHIPNTGSKGHKGTRSQIRMRNTIQKRHNILTHVCTSAGLPYFLYFSFLAAFKFRCVGGINHISMLQEAWRLTYSPSHPPPATQGHPAPLASGTLTPSVPTSQDSQQWFPSTLN
jgi:hypothetical protein